MTCSYIFLTNHRIRLVYSTDFKSIIHLLQNPSLRPKFSCWKFVFIHINPPFSIPYFPHGFCGFLWFSYDFPMVFLWFSHIFPWFRPGLVDCVPSSPGGLHEGRVVGLGGHRGGLRGDLRLGQGGRASADNAGWLWLGESCTRRKP